MKGREGRNAAKVITWFCLSWFWFRRGRVCQKSSRHSSVSAPCQIFWGEWEARGWKHGVKVGIKCTKTDREDESHPVPIKCSELTQRNRDTIENMNAPWTEGGRQEGGRWRRTGGRVLPVNEFLIARRSTVPRSSNRNKSASEYTLFFNGNITLIFLNQNESSSFCKHDIRCDTRNEWKTLKARQAGTGRLMGTFKLHTHTHTNRASWLPQVSVFTHEEHLNFKLQKHVLTLSNLSVTLPHPNNSKSSISLSW